MKKIEKIQVQLNGITPILFDRYSGDNKRELKPEEKMYFQKGTKKLIIPAANVLSFLCATNTKSAVKLFYDSRVAGKVAQNVLGSVNIFPYEIPLTREGKQLEFNDFEDGHIECFEHVARLKNGIPNPKKRPGVLTPWELSFTIDIYPNDDGIDESMIKALFDRGGIAIGLGTFRGLFGKFIVEKWGA